ncbi:MAG: 3-phosphoserine/phosphohydroxythreonine transaminase [Alicyclobacillaceae bacterium]|nr:3-phosphoserine/phosphohydroxythreonine transaminase [Alicyclobacillaceae bacterium]
MPQPKRAFNFNAGPSALPLEVLLQAQEELVDFRGTGMSVMEMSHRSKVYEEVHNETAALVRELLGVPDDYDVLFLQGGASLQFAMVPMNFLTKGKAAGYVLTGSWSEKAWQEAKRLGETFVAASTREDHYRRIPREEELQYGEDAAYLHITSNNTIFGTQWQTFPDTGKVPLIADMSSDILSRPFDVRKFALIYAGAQKNLGPAGVTLVIARKDLVERAPEDLPTMLQYRTHAKHNSLYNTPPTFAIYMMGLVLKWVKKQGGIAAIHERNREKARLIYEIIDQNPDFYLGHAEPGSRSLMNVTFRLATPELEKEFLEEAKKEGFVGLNGHRSVGGCRASLYNAVPVESCRALREYMVEFRRRHG